MRKSRKDRKTESSFVGGESAAGRAVNYKRSAKPLRSSLSGAGVSRRIDNAGLA